MNHALRRATLGLSPGLRASRLQQSFAKHQIPAVYRCEAASTPLQRAFTTSRCFRQETVAESEKDDAARREEQSERARKRQARNVTSGSSAQTLENDRPWHRADSGADPDAPKDVPENKDMKKGKLVSYDLDGPQLMPVQVVF